MTGEALRRFMNEDCGICYFVTWWNMTRIRTCGESPFSRPYEFNQCFNIIKIIVIAPYTVTMIHDAVYLVGFKTVQQGLFSVASGKQRKRIWLDFSQQSLSAIFIAAVTMSYPLIKRAIAIFTPLLIGTVSRMTPRARDVFRAEATRKTASCDTQFSLHDTLRTECRQCA